MDQEQPRSFSRRSALKFLGLLSSSVAGRDFLVAWLSGSAAPSLGSEPLPQSQAQSDSTARKSYSLKFFKQDQFRTVEALTATIIPTDETPGAKEARVAEYIDFVVFSAAEFQPSLQKDWIAGLALLDKHSQKEFGRVFREASDEQRNKLLTEMSAPERDDSIHHEGFAFFLLAKEMTVEGFYTSKIGLIDVLDYKGMNYNESFEGCTHPEHQS